MFRNLVLGDELLVAMEMCRAGTEGILGQGSSGFGGLTK